MNHSPPNYHHACDAIHYMVLSVRHHDMGWLWLVGREKMDTTNRQYTNHSALESWVCNVDVPPHTSPANLVCDTIERRALRGAYGVATISRLLQIIITRVMPYTIWH